MKIGMITQWYDPETGPASLPGTYAREMERKGHGVKVLTGYPNYPSGSLYQGYRQRVRSVEYIGRTQVTRVPLVPSHSESSIGRIANYSSFAASASILGARSLRGVDAVWAYNSPVTITLPLLLRSGFGRVPYFLHVMDLWPESLMHSGMVPSGKVGKVAEAGVRKIVKIAEQRSTVIGVISPTVRDIILERDPAIDESRIVYVPNPADESLFRPMERIRHEKSLSPDSRFFTLMYVGSVGQVQGFDTVLNAAAMLRDDPSVRIQIVGDGIARKRLQQRALNEGLFNVEFLGRVAQDEVPAVMARADAQMVTLGDSDFLRYTTPSKVSAILASGVPIVGQIAGDGARLLERSGAAMVTAPGNAPKLASSIDSMSRMSVRERNSMAEAGRAYYVKHMSVSKVTDKIVSSLEGG